MDENVSTETLFGLLGCQAIPDEQIIAIISQTGFAN